MIYRLPSDSGLRTQHSISSQGGKRSALKAAWSSKCPAILDLLARCVALSSKSEISLEMCKDDGYSESNALWMTVKYWHQQLTLRPERQSGMQRSSEIILRSRCDGIQQNSAAYCGYKMLALFHRLAQLRIVHGLFQFD